MSLPPKKLLLLALLVMFSVAAVSQIYKWVDEEGVVHYSDKPAYDRDAEEVVVGPTPPVGNDREVDSRVKEDEGNYFSPITNLRKLHGCWRRVVFSDEVMEKTNKIQLYPSAFEKHQWFCFLDDNELYTKFKDRPEELSLQELIRDITIFPAVERYSLPQRGIILIHHLEAEQKTYWVTSVAVVGDPSTAGSLQDGDILMTIRDPKTGEDIYFRHLRKIKE